MNRPQICAEARAPKRRRRRGPARPRLTTAALACFAIAAFAPRAPAGLTAEQRQAIDWYDTLGYPDLKHAAWVRVATGDVYYRGGTEPHPRSVDAFLLKSEGDTFTIFQLDAMVERTLIRTDGGAEKHERVGFDRLDLAREAAARLERLRNPPDD